MEAVHTVRIDHGAVQNAALPFSQRQAVNHRPNHNQQNDLYKPSRSPHPPAAARYPYPASPQLQTPVVSQVTNRQYAVPPAAVYPSVTYPSASYRDYKQPRISLLPTDYANNRGQHGSGGGGSGQIHYIDHSGAGQGQQPFKKMRLQDHKDIPPLRIDTRDQPGSYNPQVEAISPTLPDHLQQEEQGSSLRTTKDELLQQIGKVDREIAKTESQISILKKKEQELEENASKPPVKPEIEEDTQPKHQSLAQKIYAENRKKAQNAHGKLDPLGPKVEWPIYNQPSDASLYHENKRKHQVFKRRLLDYFKKRHLEKEGRNTYLAETYSKLMQEWTRNVDKLDAGRKRKAKDARNREFFEKVFPELRKQREDKERFNRVGARIKSEADMEEIMDNLQEQAMEDKKMRSYAVIPPILLDPKERRVTYQNNNGRIEDMEAVYKRRQYLNIWTPSEKEIFKEKYLQHPKNFGVVASYLDRKSVADCVQYYYLSKKTENFKQLLRKNRMRLRTRNNPQKVNSSTNSSVVDILTTGVTTRLQREQQQKTGVVGNSTTRTEQNETSTSPISTTTASATVSSPTSTTATSSVSTPTTSTNPPTSPVTTTVISTAMTVANNPGTPQEPERTANSEIGANTEDVRAKDSETSDAKVVETNVGGEGREEEQKRAETAREGEGSAPEPMESEPVVAAESTTVSEIKKKVDRRKDKEETVIETSDEEAADIKDKAIHGQCVVCNAQLVPQLQSRPVPPSQASHYGLREDQVPQNARVCNTCRCKCVRSRYTHCPLPTCPNSRGRVKRLRSFPQRLQDLPHEVREPLLAEFHVPSGVTKCCSACFNRIQRRLGPIEEWSEEEMGKLRTALTDLGGNWQLIGERLGKPAQVVRSYYAANRKRLNLESCLGDRKPTLTDEEESGSSTSSCEPMRERHSSDTASAESPQASQEQPQNQGRKDEYDSSATETADERQTPENYQVPATITPVNNNGQPRQNTSPLTVKDLMLNVIEISLMKNAGAQQNQHPPTSALAPTISSILNNDSNEVTIVSEYNLNNQPRTTNQRNEMSLAKLTPLIAATITPVPNPVQQQQEPQNQRDDLVVLQVQDREQENMTLDLSIKKPRELPPPVHPKQQHPNIVQQQIHRSEAYSMGYHQERKSPAVYVSAVPRVQPKLPSPKPANPKTGSITQGTPIISQPKYEGLLRQMTPEPKMGSITQGTPMHVPHMQDKRVYEYYNKRAPVPQNNPQVPQGQTYPGQYRQPAYSVEQQLSSRQIIINDYITSQHMLTRRNDTISKPQYYPSNSPHRTPPPVQQAQQRQGVIQRHIRPHYPPGHEALSSLVDVAVQQPNLPVPSAPHEGLGKTMADNIMEQPHRLQILHQQQLRQQQQQRMDAERRAYQQMQQQARQPPAGPPRSESSTLTAASLIDAIITHQINQTAEGGREVVQNQREPPRPSDRLFQSFHREQPSQENDHDRSPNIINVDLDNEQMNKNLTVKELTDTVISHDFGGRQPSGYYHLQESRRRLQQQQHQQQQQGKDKRSLTPQQDERHIIRIAQPQKYHVEPVSPPESNHWTEQNFRRYQQPQSHISALDYVKNRIVEVMRTEDDKKELQQQEHGHPDKDRSDSPGEMVIDEGKHDEQFSGGQPQYGGYQYVKDGGPGRADVGVRNDEPKPLLSEQYEPLSDED